MAGPTIQLDSLVVIHEDRSILFFINLCIIWTSKIDSAIGGSVSLKFKHPASNQLVAEFRYLNRPLALLRVFDNHMPLEAWFPLEGPYPGSDIYLGGGWKRISPEQIWKMVFQPGILRILDSDIYQLGRTRKQVESLELSQ